MQSKLFDALSLFEKKKLQYWVHEHEYNKEDVKLEFKNGDALAKIILSKYKSDSINLSFGILVDRR